MQREVKIGMSVVYQAGEGDPPMGPYVTMRAHPALVTQIRRTPEHEGLIDVVILPFMAHSHYYRGAVPRGNAQSTSACWYYPEEG